MIEFKKNSGGFDIYLNEEWTGLDFIINPNKITLECYSTDEYCTSENRSELSIKDLEQILAKMKQLEKSEETQ